MRSVAEIIGCKKEIINKRRPNFREEFQHYRMNIDLQCDDESIKTAMFLRRKVVNPEDFTVGLKLLTPNDMGHEAALLRYQGPHGGQSQSHSLEDLHNDYHVHYYSEQDYFRKKKL